MYLLIDNAGTTALGLPETSHRSEGGAYRTLLANFLLRPQTFFSSKEIEKIKGESRKISKKFVGEPDSTKRDCSQILQGGGGGPRNPSLGIRFTILSLSIGVNDRPKKSASVTVMASLDRTVTP